MEFQAILTYFKPKVAQIALEWGPIPSSSVTTTSSSTGYHADGSSGGGTATTTGSTNSSEESKRSRESMRIEEPIGPHHIHSPLPKYPLPKVRKDSVDMLLYGSFYRKFLHLSLFLSKGTTKVNQYQENQYPQLSLIKFPIPF